MVGWCRLQWWSTWQVGQPSEWSAVFWSVAVKNSVDQDRQFELNTFWDAQPMQWHCCAREYMLMLNANYENIIVYAIEVFLNITLSYVTCVYIWCLLTDHVIMSRDDVTGVQIDWYREVGGLSPPTSGHTSSISIGAGGTTVTKRSVHGESSSVEAGAVPIATGKRVVMEDGRYRVYRPHNSALSVLIIRRAKKRDAGIYRCNLAGSTTRHKYMVLNVTGRCQWRVFCVNNVCIHNKWERERERKQDVWRLRQWRYYARSRRWAIICL